MMQDLFGDFGFLSNNNSVRPSSWRTRIHTFP